MTTLRAARNGDRVALGAFLAGRPDTSMMLRANLRAVGLAWTPPGVVGQGEYEIACRGNVVVGVVCHAWNGKLLVQADEAAGALAVACTQRTSRPIRGLVGPLAQVDEVRAALGITAARKENERELLMALSLDELVVPPALVRSEVDGRRASARDREVLIAWRRAYLIETALDGRAEAAIDEGLARGTVWIATRDGVPVAMCMFNAVLPDAVQVGGVYTPSDLRGRAYARVVVAAALLAARDAGALRATLFTPRPDAVAAYRALGFTALGSYAFDTL